MDNPNQTFVTGWPVEHSRSPLIHNYWIEKYGLEGCYVKHPNDPDQIGPFMFSLKNSKFVGGNVTLPHKETVFSLVDITQPAAKRLGAVNTVWLENDQIVGDNTDGYGFLANLDQQAPGWDGIQNQKRGALVLGAGGAARAVIDGLLERGFSPVIIANRTVSRAEELAHKFGKNCEAIDISKLSETTLRSAIVVNTTSVGMDDAESPIDVKGFEKNVLVTDIVYTPLQTPLLKQAATLGMKTVDGLGMLLHQAVPGFERWYGVRPEVTDELRHIILDDLRKTS